MQDLEIFVIIIKQNQLIWKEFLSLIIIWHSFGKRIQLDFIKL